MQVDVIVMAEKNTQSIMDWQLRPDRNGKLRAVYPNGSVKTPERAWKDLALTINRRALRGNHTPLEVFLYLREGLHNSIYDYGILESIVAGALDHAWYGKLYVAWDRLPEKAFAQTFSEESNRILLAKCFCAFLREGVADLIEVTRKEKLQEDFTFEEKKKILRGCAVNAEKRREALKAVVSEEGWGYVLRNEAWLLDRLLNEFATDD